MNISAANSAPVKKAYNTPTAYTPPPPKKDDAALAKPDPKEQTRGSNLNIKV